MELSVYEAIQAIKEAIKQGETPKLVIDGKTIEIKQNGNYDVVCYEVVK